MDNITTFPVATYGRDPKIAEAVREKLLPDYEVVHCCLDFAAALKELPAICAGELETSPSSGLGANASTAAAQRKVPKAIFFGGGFNDDEFENITAAVRARAGPGVYFVKVQKRDVLAAGSFGPNPDTIAKIYRKKMATAMAAA
ncbi:hypothetical protein B0H66DRAFT_600361 [Apodospora peruviana]|uniref:Uncharacterized protein n=1 Tax=Apodospora peruviana TaxID=516989 RepID=A0AAE0MBL5_9PEZI|nr:hypothetical protein B0H66DRAFT_600361 [Apodospora peruviana]